LNVFVACSFAARLGRFSFLHIALVLDAWRRVLQAVSESLTSHWTHNGPGWRRLFIDNRLHWYWQPHNCSSMQYSTEQSW